MYLYTGNPTKPCIGSSVMGCCLHRDGCLFGIIRYLHVYCHEHLRLFLQSRTVCMRTCARGELITTTERETEMITTLPPMVLPSSVVVAVVGLVGGGGGGGGGVGFRGGVDDGAGEVVGWGG